MSWRQSLHYSTMIKQPAIAIHMTAAGSCTVRSMTMRLLHSIGLLRLLAAAVKHPLSGNLVSL